MTTTIAHTKVSTKLDSSDPSLVRPSDWNADHTIPQGTAAAPGVAFTADPDSGLFGISPNILGFATGGTERARLDSAGLHVVDGTAPAPGLSFTSDADTGLYRIGANIVGVAIGGAERARFDATGISIDGGVSYLGTAPYPNLLLNSDFGRRTVFGLAMLEVFADTSGATAVDGSLGSVASNVLTAGTNGTWSIKWCGTNSTFYRDGRFSALAKQNGTGTTNVGRIGVGKNDGTAWTAGNGVYATYFRTALNTVTLEVLKVIAGVTTQVALSAGLTWTDGRVGWVELEAQGTTYIAKLYDQGSGTPGVKSSATLLGTATGTVADAGVVSGQPAVVNGSGVGAATVWGGVSTGNGGVYVETWLPESWAVTFGGTLGGQAIAYDEAADSGPLTKQYTPVVYIPATSRTVTVQLDSPDGGMVNSTAYTASYYEKNTSLGGSGVMVRAALLEQNSAQATQATTNIDDAAETSYTRKTSTVTTNAATRRFRWQFLINPSSTRTGTVRFSLPQLEQGSAATAWRNAPADDAPIVWQPVPGAGAPTTYATTSGTMAEIDSRDLAIDVFMPWDGILNLSVLIGFRHSTAGSPNNFSFTVDGTDVSPGGTSLVRADAQSVSNYGPLTMVTTKAVAAGKHRIAVTFSTAGATLTLLGKATTYSTPFIITATRGK